MNGDKEKNEKLDMNLKEFISNFVFVYNENTAWNAVNGDDEEFCSEGIKFLSKYSQIPLIALALGIAWPDRHAFNNIRSILRKEAERLNMTEDIYLEKIIYPEIENFRNLMKGWSRVLYALNYIKPKKGKEKWLKNPDVTIKIDGEYRTIKTRIFNELKTAYSSEPLVLKERLLEFSTKNTEIDIK